MVRDKNSEKRYTFDLQILDKEREIEETHSKQRQAEDSMANFRVEMEQNFRQLQEIEDELNMRSQAQNAYSETEQKRRYILNLLSQQQEEMATQYRKANNSLEDEREALQKERNQLAWD